MKNLSYFYIFFLMVSCQQTQIQKTEPPKSVSVKPSSKTALKKIKSTEKPAQIEKRNEPSKLACKTVDDCTKTTNNVASGGNCCHGCFKQPISKVWAEKIENECRTKAFPSKPCEQLHCARQSNDPLLCVEQKCILSSQSHSAKKVETRQESYLSKLACDTADDCMVSTKTGSTEGLCCYSCGKHAVSKTWENQPCSKLQPVKKCRKVKNCARQLSPGPIICEDHQCKFAKDGIK